MSKVDDLKKIRQNIAAETFRELSKLDPSDPGIRSLESARMKRLILREGHRTNATIALRAIERRIGNNNESRDQPPNETARRRGKPVARVHEILDDVQPVGFGSGFLVAPNILLTNHHVFPNRSYAENCAANFLHEKNENGNISNGVTFRLKPGVFFYSYDFLDIALVYVEDRSIDGAVELSSLEFLPLIATQGKIAKEKPLSLIQYPGGEYKRYTFEENLVTLIDDINGNVYYTTDSEQGSSGSPGFNEFWEVSALHFTGVPRIVDGKWMTKDNEVWDEATMSEEEVDWIANAGKSISKIVDHLAGLSLEEEKQKYIERVLKYSQDPLMPESTSDRQQNTQPNVVQEKDMKEIVFNFYGPTNVYLQTGTVQTAGAEAGSAVEPKNENLLPTEKKERFDENYDDRTGYDENFLKGFRVPMPTVIKDRDDELYKRFGESKPYIVPYHHYSLVMNKKRRFMMWSAANVDYSERLRDKRKREDFGSGAWRIDRRVPTKYQVQAEEFYDPATLIDKGHIVRRDDNCWAYLKNGETDSLGIEYANADSYHWTNCTPQHEAFNQDMGKYKGKGKWGVLENAIKEQLEKNDSAGDNDYNRRACILAGPVLLDGDPEYLDIQYPLQFWKVFVIVSKTEGPLVYGFLLSQKDRIDATGLEKEAKPRFSKMVEAMQASLEQIEELTGVVFDPVLHEFDVKRGDNPDANESLRDDLTNFKAARIEKAAEDVLGGARARQIVSGCAHSTAWTATLGDLGLDPLIFRQCVSNGVDAAGYVPPDDIPASPDTRLIDVVYAIQGAPRQ